MNFKLKIMSAGLLVSTLLASCTKLDEEKFGSLAPDNYYQDEQAALSSVVGVYQLLSYNVDIGDPWRMKEFSTDEFIVPGRASGGWFDQSNVDLTKHVQNADNNTVARAWTQIFQEIGTANAVLESLQASPNKDKLKALIAETRALRAYGYFFAMDNWGNVPLVTVARIDPKDLPKTTARADVYKLHEKNVELQKKDLLSYLDLTKNELNSNKIDYNIIVHRINILVEFNEFEKAKSELITAKGLVEQENKANYTYYMVKLLDTYEKYFEEDYFKNNFVSKCIPLNLDVTKEYLKNASIYSAAEQVSFMFGANQKKSNFRKFCMGKSDKSIFEK